MARRIIVRYEHESINGTIQSGELLLPTTRRRVFESAASWPTHERTIRKASRLHGAFKSFTSQIIGVVDSTLFQDDVVTIAPWVDRNITPLKA